MGERSEKLRQWWGQNEQKIVVGAIFCLISAISYEFGALKGQKLQQKPLVIEKPVSVSCEGQAGNQGDSGASGAQPQGANAPAKITSGAATGKCAFVGSKNSTKFYVPSCSWAKRIKPENLACYQSEQEALSKGKTKSDCK